MTDDVRRDVSHSERITYIDLGPFKVRLFIADEKPGPIRTIVISASPNKRDRVAFSAVSDGMMMSGYVADDGSTVIESSEKWEPHA